MRDIKKSIILGFGLFAMFFGAGNTLLPSYIAVSYTHLTLPTICSV